MKIELLSPALEDIYQDYLLSNPQSLFYYSIKYKRFLKELLGCEEQYLLALQDGEVKGVLPLMYYQQSDSRLYNSLPYYGSNGGILTTIPEAEKALVNVYNEVIRAANVLAATVVTNPLLLQKENNFLYNYTDSRIGQWTNISIAVEENIQQKLLDGIDGSARRNIKKALSSEIEVSIDHSAFPRLKELHQTNISSIGGSFKTEKFFSLVPKHFKPGEDYDLFVAKKDGLVIAALLLFYFNKTVEYFTPALQEEYRSLQAIPLIIITAMENAAQRGFKWWNWGGTWQSQEGVYRFKKKWGAIDKRYYYYTQVNDLSLLSRTPSDLLSLFPNFYVLPFSELHSNATN